LQHGLLRASFVPDTPQRELRELTRQRRQLVQDRATVVNRVQKVLEDADLKFGVVATDVLGASGRDMLEAIAAGQDDPVALAELARGRLRVKILQLRLALRGRVTAHHRFLLRLLLDDLAHREGLIGRLTERKLAWWAVASMTSRPRRSSVKLSLLHAAPRRSLSSSQRTCSRRRSLRPRPRRSNWVSASA
jgi:hypothetical protein